MRIRVAEPACTIRRVASSPSTLGMRMFHQRHVGLEAPNGRDRLLAVGGLGDDVDVRLRLQQGAKARADHRLVVGDDDPDAHGVVIGSEALTTKPPPAPGCVSSHPP